MSEWQTLNRSALAALRSGDLARADELLVETWTEARRRGDRELEANTYFTEGMLRDAQDRLADAEAAFGHALAIDREIYGPHHAAVADVLHSLAIVRGRRDDREGALAAYREEVDVLRATQPFAIARGMSSVGIALLGLGRFDDALVAFEDAVTAAEEHEHTPLHEWTRAHLGAGEVYRQTKQFPAAFGSFALATQIDGAKLANELGDAVARAWFSVGFVSRYGLQDCKVQAAIALWYATHIAPPDIAERARNELVSLAERRYATGDPKAWRVTYNAGGHAHVASLTWGIFHTIVEVTAEVGAIVDVELDVLGVVAVTQRAD